MKSRIKETPNLEIIEETRKKICALDELERYLQDDINVLAASQRSLNHRTSDLDLSYLGQTHRKMVLHSRTPDHDLFKDQMGRVDLELGRV